jgi:hypothetical protein
MRLILFLLSILHGIIVLARPKDGTYYFNQINTSKSNAIIAGTFTIKKNNVTVSVGCNSISTAINFGENDSIKPNKQISSTKKLCKTKDLRKAEYLLSSILKSVTRYEVHKDRIDLYTEDFLNLRLTSKPIAYSVPKKPTPQIALEEGLILYTLKGDNWDGILKAQQDGSLLFTFNSPDGNYTCKNIKRNIGLTEDTYTSSCYIGAKGMPTLIIISNKICLGTSPGRTYVTTIKQANDAIYNGCATQKRI